MKREMIIIRKSHCNSALRVLCRGFFDRVLGHYQHGPLRGQRNRSAQSRHTRAYYQKVEGLFFVMTQFVFLCLLSLVAIAAPAADFFPLISGSSWLYRSASGDQQLTIRIGSQSEFAGRAFHRLEGYTARPLWVRQASPLLYTYWDEARREELPFLSFDGEDFPSPANDCAQTGQLSRLPADYRGPIGIFPLASEIYYRPGRCADTGLTRETFGDGLGLLERRETSLIGERTLHLVYAQLGGITYIQEPSLQFTLSLTTAEKRIHARLVLHNRTAEPLSLRFPSSQEFDYIVRNARGETVYRWAADKIFLQAEVHRRITGEAVWATSFSLPNLPPGLYSVEAILVNADGQTFSATSPLRLP